MIELFEELPIEVKQQNEAMVDLIFKTLNPFQIDAFLKSYKATCETEEEKNFIDFLIQLKLEKYRNESNSD